MTNKSGQTSQTTNELRDELIWDELCQVPKVGVSFCQYNNIAVINIFNKKRKSCNHGCSDSVYFIILLFIFECYRNTNICHREMSLIGSISYDT